MGPSPRLELERIWRERVRKAHLEYKNARDQAWQTVTESGPGEVPNADGFLLMHQNHMAELRASREYMRVMRIFHDLVVHGKTPSEE